MLSRFTRLRQATGLLNANLLAVIATALAFALRVYRLNDSNIWWDEGWTIWLSRQDPLAIALRTASDEHPPLHYWLMHLWTGAAGTDAFAGRFFSLFFGVLMVALVYRTGRLIGGRWLGVMAAALLGISRFSIWWSQDIKNYTLSGFFALASMWFVLRLVNAPPARWRDRNLWIGYILTITLALYSHYLAALILLADNLLMLILLIREWLARRSPITLLLRWSAAQGAVLALFAPWMALYLSNAITYQAAPAFNFGVFMRLTATVFALGITTYIEDYAAVVAVFTLLALVGISWVMVRGLPRGVTVEVKWGAVLCLLVVAVPPLLIYVLSLTPASFFAPKIQARYLLILLPAYLLLLSLGILFLARSARWLAAVAFALVAVAMLFSLHDYYGERVRRDDYATLAQVVNSFAAPGDAIVLNTDQEWPTFLYYLDPARNWDWVPVPNGSNVDDAGAHRVAAQAKQYKAVWLVTIPDALEKDPARRVEAALAGEWPKQYEQSFGDKRLTLYAARSRDLTTVTPGNFRPLARRADDFGGGLRLAGLDLPVSDARPGDTVRVVTYWDAAMPATVGTRLRSAAPTDAPPAESQTTIPAGRFTRVESDFAIPPGSAPGSYVFTAFAAESEPGSEFLASLRVLPSRPLGQPARAGGELTTPLNVRLGDSIVLAGYDLQTKTFREGDHVPLTLYWQALHPVTNSYTVFVHLLGSQYNPTGSNFLWGQVDNLPVGGTLSTAAWPPGQLIADPYQVPISKHAPPGLYKLEVGMYDAEGTRLRLFDKDGKDLGDALIVDSVEIK